MNKRLQRADRISVIDNWIRLKGHTILATLLMAFNVLVLLPLALFTWISTITGTFAFRWLIDIGWGPFLFLWILPLLTWHYTTVTIPIKKGHKYIIDWSDRKHSRFLAMGFNLLAFHIMSWTAAGKYATLNYLDYLSSVHVPKEAEGLLLVDNLNSLILLIYFLPAIISAIVLFAQLRDLQINFDLLSSKLLKWESPFFTRFVHNADINACDVIVGYDAKTKKPLVIKEDQRFLHEGSFGATGSGKTSTAILLRIVQDLIKIATGRRKMGLVFLEPKGDGVEDVLTLCKKLGIPDEKIMVIDPTKAFTIKYNPFSGPLEAAASSFAGTIDALTGDQDDFFKGQQNEAAKTYTMLAKIRYGNLTNITHIQRMFQDPRYLADIVEEVRTQIDTKREQESNSREVSSLLDSWERTVRYFENDILDYKTYRDREDIRPVLYPSGHQYEGEQVVENKKDKFVTGAKQYLNDIALNSYLSSLFVNTEGEKVFDADEFLKNGGVLLVNTALGELEELSLMFGQFFIRQFQSAVFRRPKEGRIPIFFYVDEFPLYMNEAFERFLTLGRSYKVGSLIAMQSLGQLDNVIKGFKETILSNTSSKTVFGRGTVADNKYFSEEFGEKLVVEESVNESASPMTVDSNTWGFRMNTQKKLAPRFTPSEIRELPFKHMVVQVVNENNSIDLSTKAIGKFVHEARFVKRYLQVNADEIKSTNEKDFEIDKWLDEKTKKTLENVVTSAVSSEQVESDKQEAEKVPVSVSTEPQPNELLMSDMQFNSIEETKPVEQEQLALFGVEDEIIIPDDPLPIEQVATTDIAEPVEIEAVNETQPENAPSDIELTTVEEPTEAGESAIVELDAPIQEDNEVSIPNQEINNNIQNLIVSVQESIDTAVQFKPMTEAINEVNELTINVEPILEEPLNVREVQYDEIKYDSSPKKEPYTKVSTIQADEF
ncbi:type IV secretory system conjugative DNA transfer family protein [Viridibacillus arvi]|uniref:type IV secretory system conjugative DNA transfer family protein n=1 Tax=Viridibacillus arvi TaxID=263475 RepID=UPI0034CE0BBB